MRLRDARWHVAAAIACVGIGAAGAAPAPAAERTLELVTPSGGSPDVKWGGGTSTEDGDIVCFNAESVIADSASNGNVTADDGFCSTRTAAGWNTSWVTGPAPRELYGDRGSQVFFLSADGRRVVFASDAGIFPDFPGIPGTTVASTASAMMHEGGATRWLAPTPDPSREFESAFHPQVRRIPLAASRDLRHGMFMSVLNLVPEDQNGKADVYEWTPDGIRLVSRDRTGTAVGAYPPVGIDAEQMKAEPGAVSADGSRVFFERIDGPSLEGAPTGVYSVFMRRGDELTHVSPRLGVDPAADVRFVGAYVNGTIVYLRTSEQLTGTPKAAGQALYRYDTESETLTLIADDPVAGQTAFLGASEDGETIVYTRGTDPDLYVRNGSGDHLVGTLFFGDVEIIFDSGASKRSDKRMLRLSADGRTLVFSSYNSVIPSDPTGFKQQIYRWTEADGVRRISAAQDGSPAQDDAFLGNFSSTFPGRLRYLQTNSLRKSPNEGRGMSDDGSRVFFETAERLVGADVNGKTDVYEWYDGDVSLVSPGNQRDHALFHDNSADGRTVFFTTQSRLIPELDRNSSRDLYAAREGGGFAIPKPPERCLEDTCQPPSPTPPTLPQTGSDTFEGDDDTLDPVPPASRITVARITAKQRRAFARSGSLVVRARVNVRGVVTATATARVGRRSVRVARTKQAALDNTTVSLPLRLTRGARRALRRTGRLRVTIRVAYSEIDQPVTRVVVLRG